MNCELLFDYLVNTLLYCIYSNTEKNLRVFAHILSKIYK